jgi:hypothetical protein
MIEPLRASSRRLRDIWSTLGLGEPNEAIAVTNVGDGAALTVHIKGVNCKALGYVLDETDPRGSRTFTTVARIQATETIGIFVWHGDITKPDESNVSITWTTSPVRHRKRHNEQISIAARLREIQSDFEDSFGS